ncbi:hypothetical protein A3BBH6_06810 [Alistipes onderdonkii subsp. vulgaris]|uniref:hypothetical protein n=1 Tax=Alistipes onderdonkii TaxID=328813 RepID=UPI0011446728|nr:hypothetical protein [Alistipes onderdonkii]BBL00445.1 hypothetical protein A3BBH6_06810 [Alistipes onderdonkii subsp. vulgaris]
MTTFKKGQRVWWEDSQDKKSGEYEVFDPQNELNAGKPESERIIHIGDGKKTWDVPADCLTLVCPISDVDREQLAMQEHRNRLRDKELIEHMQELVAQFEDQTFEVEGHSVRIADEDHDACCVYGFCVEEGVLYALLDYDDGGLRTVPVSDLCAVELFDAFCLLVKDA